MRRMTYPGIGVVAAVAIGLLAGPASAPAAAVPAATDAPARVVQDLATQSAVALPALPSDSMLTAGFPASRMPALPVSARSITVTLPPEAADFGVSEVRARLRGSAGGVPATLPVVSGAVVLELPDGFFDSAAGTPRVELNGDRTMALHLDGNGAAASVPLPDGSYRRAAVSFTLTFALAPATEVSALAVNLSLDAAGSITSFRRFDADTQLEYLGSAGDTISFVPPGASLPSSVSASIGSRITDLDVPLTAALVGNSVVATLPDAAALEPYLDDNGHVGVTLSGLVGREAVSVLVGITLVKRNGPGQAATTRISGADRFSGAIDFFRAAHPAGYTVSPAPVAYFVTGASFPDALSASAAAAAQHGGLLLVRPGGADETVLDAARSPQIPRQVVVGGYSSVDGIWDSLLCCGSGGFDRIGGADRYAVSRSVALTQFPEGAATVFLATGATFSDALSAVPAAGSLGSPVLLVAGSQPALDAATTGVLSSLHARNFVLVGGPASISPGIQSQLEAAYPGAVTRIGGADRYAVSAAINRSYFPAASEVFFATGATFSDALTGGVLAASRNAPLLLTHQNCVPGAALDDLEYWGVERATLLGGPVSLGQGVLDLARC